MIKPEDDIVIAFKLRICNGNGLVGVVRENREGACCVEADAFDRTGVDAILAYGSLD